MYCRKCGKNIPEDSKFCPHCGKPITNAQGVNATEKPGKHYAREPDFPQAPRAEQYENAPHMETPPVKQQHSVSGMIFGSIIVILALFVICLSIYFFQAKAGNDILLPIRNLIIGAPDVPPNTHTATPATKLTPTPSPKVTPCPIELEGMRLSRNIIGIPEVAPVFTNNTEKTIDGIKVAVECFNNFGDPVTPFGIDGDSLLGDKYFSGISQEVIEPGNEFPKGRMWTLNLYETATEFKLAVYSVHFSDGTSWSNENPEELYWVSDKF